MAGRGRSQAPWSELPTDLLHKISQSLDAETETPRLRAVCRSWRSATPPTKDPPPIRLPLFPFMHRVPETYFNLIERTVYLLQSPDISEDHAKSSWVVKIEKTENGRVKILNPLNDQKIQILPDQTLLPKVLNTLNFRISKLCKAYDLMYVKPNYKNDDRPKYVKKLVVSRPFNSAEEYLIMAIDLSDRLWSIRSGDEEWSRVDCFKFPGMLVDIGYHKGQFHVNCSSGSTLVFDSSFKLSKTVSFASSFPGSSKGHFLELEGELCKVEEIIVAVRSWTCRFNNARTKYTTAGIKMYRIHEQKQEWVEEKLIKGQIIFIGDDCSFSISAASENCEGARVFYSDQSIFFRTEMVIDHRPQCGCPVEFDFGDEFDMINSYFKCDSCHEYVDGNGRGNYVPREDVRAVFRGLNGHNTGVCDFATGKHGSVLKFPELAAGIFWPPPSWVVS